MGERNTEEQVSTETMTKKRRRTAQQAASAPQSEPPPKPKKFAPSPCPSCVALAKGENYSEVYATVKHEGTVIRYCRCRLCRNTFKMVQT